MLIYRLQFSDVFPEEEKKDLIDYLKNIKVEFGRKIGGFTIFYM